MRIVPIAVALLLTSACSSETEPPPQEAPPAPRVDPPEEDPGKGKKGKGRKGAKKPPKPPAAPADCKVNAVVDDPNPKGLNIRAEPNGDAEVLGQIPKGVMLSLAGSQGSWVRFDKAWDPENEKEYPNGWVAGGLLTTTLKTPAEYGPDTQPKLRKKPADDAETDDLPFEPMPELTVTGCDGNFLKVKAKVAKGDVRVGWLGVDSHCGNPVTTCP